MSHPLRRQVSYSFGGPLTPAVKYIIVATTVVFLLQVLFPQLTPALALKPWAVVASFHVWELLTYLLVHGTVSHLFFNMLFLFMFGCELERMWGGTLFVRFYVACGVGAGLFALLPIPEFYGAAHIGASGAVYGVLMAYGLYFPNRIIYFMMMFPIQVKYFVAISGILVFLNSVQAAVQGGSGVSHIAHLGGLVAGYLYLKLGLGRVRLQLGFGLKEAYRRWRMKRLRKKFEQYYQKRGGGGGGPQYTVH